MKDAHTIAKELEQRYGTKQRDELRLKHPAIADGVEKIEETFGPVNLRNIVTKEEQITTKQMDSLHLWFRQIANALNDAGWDAKKTLKAEVEIPWTEHMVKSLLWKSVQRIMVEKESTKELTTKDVNKIYEVVDRHLSSKTGVHVEFPKDEEKP